MLVCSIIRLENRNETHWVSTKLNLEKMSKQKITLISGVTGQDGSYLAEFCVEKRMSNTKVVPKEDYLCVSGACGIQF